MAAVTTDITITTSWTKIADSGATVEVSSATGDFRIAYGSSTPSVRGHKVCMNLIYSKSAITANLYAKSDSTSSVSAELTTE